MAPRRRARAPMAALLALASALPACARCHPVQRAPGRVVDLDTELRGLSGLTRDADGVLWTVAERGEGMARIDPSTFAVTPIAIEGVPPGSELEAMAATGGGRFALGTESQAPDRAADRILVATVGGAGASVASSRAFDYGPWGLHASANHGVEGLCAAADGLLVATELVQTRGGARWAPVGWLARGSGRVTPHRLRLTTDTGKLAAIDCREVEGGVEALAVERHFGVARLLRFRVPRAEEGREIVPTIAVDLADHVEPLPNFEGLVWDADGSALLLTDNQYRVDTGEPSRLYHVPAALLH